MNRSWCAGLAVFVVACSAPRADAERDAASAEAFFRGVYGCDAEAIREHGAPDVVISYPVFQELFGEPAVAGIDAVVSFSQRLCNRWRHPRVTIDDRVAEPGRVVLVWSFETESSQVDSTESPNEEGSEGLQKWGGISYFTVNEDGLVTSELGEESTPGPFGRLDRMTGR